MPSIKLKLLGIHNSVDCVCGCHLDRMTGHNSTYVTGCLTNLLAFFSGVNMDEHTFKRQLMLMAS